MTSMYTASEAAKELGISRPTLMKKVKQGEIKVAGYAGEQSIALFDKAYIDAEAAKRKQEAVA